MKVLMIGLTPPLEGGSQMHIQELRKRLKCDVLTQNRIYKSDFKMNVLFAVASYLWTLRLIFCRKKYDLIHIHENLLYFLAPVLKLRYKVVITVHGLKGFKFYDNKMLWSLFRNALKFSDAAIAVSLQDKDILLKEGISNVIYIPNGVDLSLYKKNPKIERKITFVGRIHPQKGIDFLLKAFKSIKTDCTLNIIGGINDYALELQKKYPDERIIWRGYISDKKLIAEELMSSYCIVIPSVFEGLPLTLFESMASGRPIIASNLDCIKSITPAILFEPENSNELKEKIIYALKNPKKINTLGKIEKQISKAYSWASIAEKTKEVYSH